MKLWVLAGGLFAGTVALMFAAIVAASWSLSSIDWHALMGELGGLAASYEEGKQLDSRPEKAMEDR